MASLAAAHLGYEYQDLLAAARLVDMMLGTLAEAHVDQKLVADDRFDDLTTIDTAGRRERCQFKHTENHDRPLTLQTFVTDARGLRLDRLVAAALADRDGPGAQASELSFRLVLRDTNPVDVGLLAVLRPAEPDPGPFLPSMQTHRMRFDAAALASSRGGVDRGQDPLGALLRQAFALPDLEWACERLIVEVDAPAFSGDPTNPGPAEQLLLTRLRDDVGAGLYPNTDRLAVNVAEAVIHAVRSARQGRLIVTESELLRRAHLRQDFGAVARSHPVDNTIEVPRPSTVDDLIVAATAATATGGRVLILGSPGQGKSWTCEQLVGKLTEQGWLVAEHYCYLGDADGDRLPRVLSESVFGSLLGRLADAEPSLVSDQRPRFAADEQALVSAVERALDQRTNRPVALVVDGIDHVTRVRGGGPAFDPSFTLAEALSGLDLPLGSVLIVLSQYGAHLDPLKTGPFEFLDVPGLTDAELHELAAHLGVVPERHETSAGAATSLLSDPNEVAEFLRVLGEKSSGNALYATYICREARRRPEIVANPIATVRGLPPFDGSLHSYYQHLQTSLGDQGGWVADVIALLDFPVTVSELKEIRPDAAHRVDDALAVLEPVLAHRFAERGVRVYHESFARFLRLPFQVDTTARVALLDRITSWLKAKGMLTDDRAFRSLLPLLADQGQDDEVVGMVGYDFVADSVAAGFPASAIMANLAIAVASAARVNAWPTVVRYVEMARAAETYQEERFESSFVRFADVPLALLGTQTVADRLLVDGRPVMAARAGLQMCAAVDKLGAVAPWHEYMTAYVREAESDNTSYAEASEAQVSLAWLRGRLRLSSAARTIPDARPDDASNQAAGNGPKDGSHSPEDFTAPMRWHILADSLNKSAALSASEVMRAVSDTHGLAATKRLIELLTYPGSYELAVAEAISARAIPDSDETALVWAQAASRNGVPPGNVHRLIAQGVGVEEVVTETVAEARVRLIDLTRGVQEPSVRREWRQLAEWLDACVVAAFRDPLGLNAAEAVIAARGWYGCWLRFTICLARVEAAPEADQSRLAVAALRILREELNPFAGDPRACDLYDIHDVINSTIRRAVSRLSDEDWDSGLVVLSEVSAGISTTMFGELGGPVPADKLMRIAVESAIGVRHPAAASFIGSVIDEGAAGRYYEDLADYRLWAARLALAVGDRPEADRLWVDACRLLTAYGWHKDITIYELIDPLPTLIEADPARGRKCVEVLQPLCERIPSHTDGRETRGAWGGWWRLLAQADPCALARMVTPALLATCNSPNALLHDARGDLWRLWHHAANPVAGALLRLTLEDSVGKADPPALAELASLADGSGIDETAALMTHLMARFDERPVKYSVTNSEELVESDSEVVDRLNSIAERAAVPSVAPMPDAGEISDSSSRDWEVRSASIRPQAAEGIDPDAIFDSGTVGLSRAIRAWRRRRYDESGPDWTVERFASIVGFRMVELAQQDREPDAAAALWLVADATGFGDRPGLLRTLGEGFELHGQPHLAALALTLAWTRVRGHGGWLTFGGETEVESLRRAANLDRNLTRATVAAEVQQVIWRGRSGTQGVSQALVFAFALGALGQSDDEGLDVAFQAWGEASVVIAGRAPRVDPTDDPDIPYSAPEPDDGAPVRGDLNAAFAMATFAGLAHAGREEKRRSFLAVQFLLQRPEASVAIAGALESVSDPATLVWLLRMLENAGDSATAVLPACADVLSDLAAAPHLTVRALARRLLSDQAPALSPPSEADPALLNGDSSRIWIPNDRSVEPVAAAAIAGLVATAAGARLARASEYLDGIRVAVERRVAETVEGKAHKDRMRSQLDALGDRLRKRWPDAYLAPNEAVEDALQRIAAGGRSARLAEGSPVSDPAAWEDELARAVLDDPTLPIGLEARRVPRPDIAQPPARGNALWQAMRASAASGSVEASIVQGDFLVGTLAIRPADAVAMVARGPYAGWRLLASVERRVAASSDHLLGQDSVAERMTVVEFHLESEQAMLTLPPIAAGDLRAWTEWLAASEPPAVPATSTPIIGRDQELVAAGDSREGLGIHTPLLTATPWLILRFGLRPGKLFELDDEQGPALVLITWRTEYDVSDYYLPWPRLRGAGLLIRPDVFRRLLDIGGANLILRDFLTGDQDLCAKKTEDQSGTAD